MPFVRFARDRRGYETLYVMHAFETGREGRARPRVLYAFRSVPYARVGRAPLDESVQRRIAAAYPQLDFDWPRLMKEAAASAPRPERADKREESRKGRGRDREREKKRRPQQAQGNEGKRHDGRQENRAGEVPQVPLFPQVPGVQFPVQQVPEVPEGSPAPDAVAASTDEPEREPGTEPREPAEPREPGEPLTVQVPSVPDLPLSIGPLMVDRAWPVVDLIGESRALVLRGRFIEIANRVLSRVEDPGARQRLLAEAARLNPEGWRTADEARRGVETFDAAYEALASRLRQKPSE